MTKIDTDALKSNIDLTDLASRHTDLTGHNEKYGPCPKCAGADRFHVTPAWFFCRQCHPERGDVIEFAKWLNGFDFQAACEWLSNGTPPTGASSKPTPRPRPTLKPPTEQWQARGAAVVEDAARLLWQPQGRPGLDYLLGRGLTEATIEAARLGYIPQDKTESPDLWGVSDRDTVKLHGPGILIPWHLDGHYHRLNIRLLESRGKLKYIGPAGWSGANPLYNADTLNPGRPAILVEGEFCALTINQAAGDLITAVATGSTGASRADKWIVRLAACPLVLIGFDAEPGKGKGDDTARLWLDLLPNGRRWRPLAKDVNDMQRAGLNVREWVKVGLSGLIGPEPGPKLETPPAYPICLQWPADTPTAALPPGWYRRADDTIEVVYFNDAELRESVHALALVREAAGLGGVVR